MEQTVPEQNDALKLAEEASKKKIEKLLSTKDRLDAYDLRTSLSEEEMRVYKQKLYAKLTQLELEHDIMTRKLSDVTEGVPLNEMQREHNQRKIQLGPPAEQERNHAQQNATGRIHRAEQANHT